jgi:hypothetical protein
VHIPEHALRFFWCLSAIQLSALPFSVFGIPLPPTFDVFRSLAVLPLPSSLSAWASVGISAAIPLCFIAIIHLSSASSLSYPASVALRLTLIFARRLLFLPAFAATLAPLACHLNADGLYVSTLDTSAVCFSFSDLPQLTLQLCAIVAGTLWVVFAFFLDLAFPSVPSRTDCSFTASSVHFSLAALCPVAATALPLLLITNHVYRPMLALLILGGTFFPVALCPLSRHLLFSFAAVAASLATSAVWLATSSPADIEPTTLFYLIATASTSLLFLSFKLAHAAVQFHTRLAGRAVLLLAADLDRGGPVAYPFLEQLPCRRATARGTAARRARLPCACQACRTLSLDTIRCPLFLGIGPDQSIHVQFELAYQNYIRACRLADWPVYASGAVKSPSFLVRVRLAFERFRISGTPFPLETTPLDVAIASHLVGVDPTHVARAMLVSNIRPVAATAVYASLRAAAMSRRPFSLFSSLYGQAGPLPLSHPWLAAMTAAFPRSAVVLFLAASELRFGFRPFQCSPETTISPVLLLAPLFATSTTAPKQKFIPKTLVVVAHHILAQAARHAHTQAAGLGHDGEGDGDGEGDSDSDVDPTATTNDEDFQLTASVCRSQRDHSHTLPAAHSSLTNSFLNHRWPTHLQSRPTTLEGVYPLGFSSALVAHLRCIDTIRAMWLCRAGLQPFSEYKKLDAARANALSLYRDVWSSMPTNPIVCLHYARFLAIIANDVNSATLILSNASSPLVVRHIVARWNLPAQRTVCPDVPADADVDPAGGLEKERTEALSVLPQMGGMTVTRQLSVLSALFGLARQANDADVSGHNSVASFETSGTRQASGYSSQLHNAYPHLSFRALSRLRLFPHHSYRLRGRASRKIWSRIVLLSSLLALFILVELVWGLARLAVIGDELERLRDLSELSTELASIDHTVKVFAALNEGTFPKTYFEDDDWTIVGLLDLSTTTYAASFRQSAVNAQCLLHRVLFGADTGSCERADIARLAVAAPYGPLPDTMLAETLLIDNALLDVQILDIVPATEASYPASLYSIVNNVTTQLLAASDAELSSLAVGASGLSAAHSTRLLLAARYVSEIRARCVTNVADLRTAALYQIMSIGTTLAIFIAAFHYRFQYRLLPPLCAAIATLSGTVIDAPSSTLSADFFAAETQLVRGLATLFAAVNKIDPEDLIRSAARAPQPGRNVPLFSKKPSMPISHQPKNNLSGAPKSTVPTALGSAPTDIPSSPSTPFAVAPTTQAQRPPSKLAVSSFALSSNRTQHPTDSTSSGTPLALPGRISSVETILGLGSKFRLNGHQLSWSESSQGGSSLPTLSVLLPSGPARLNADAYADADSDVCPVPFYFAGGSSADSFDSSGLIFPARGRPAANGAWGPVLSDDRSLVSSSSGGSLRSDLQHEIADLGPVETYSATLAQQRHSTVAVEALLDQIDSGVPSHTLHAPPAAVSNSQRDAIPFSTLYRPRRLKLGPTHSDDSSCTGSALSIPQLEYPPHQADDIFTVVDLSIPESGSDDPEIGLLSLNEIAASRPAATLPSDAPVSFAESNGANSHSASPDLPTRSLSLPLLPVFLPAYLSPSSSSTSGSAESDSPLVAGAGPTGPTGPTDSAPGQPGPHKRHQRHQRSSSSSHRPHTLSFSASFPDLLADPGPCFSLLLAAQQTQSQSLNFDALPPSLAVAPSPSPSPASTSSSPAAFLPGLLAPAARNMRQSVSCSSRSESRSCSASCMSLRPGLLGAEGECHSRVDRLLPRPISTSVAHSGSDNSSPSSTSPRVVTGPFAQSDTSDSDTMNSSQPSPLGSQTVGMPPNAAPVAHEFSSDCERLLDAPDITASPSDSSFSVSPLPIERLAVFGPSAKLAFLRASPNDASTPTTHSSTLSASTEPLSPSPSTTTTAPQLGDESTSNSNFHMDGDDSSLADPEATLQAAALLLLPFRQPGTLLPAVPSSVSSQSSPVQSNSSIVARATGTSADGSRFQGPHERSAGESSGPFSPPEFSEFSDSGNFGSHSVEPATDLLRASLQKQVPGQQSPSLDQNGRPQTASRTPQFRSTLRARRVVTSRSPSPSAPAGHVSQPTANGPKEPESASLLLSRSSAQVTAAALALAGSEERMASASALAFNASFLQRGSSTAGVSATAAAAAAGRGTVGYTTLSSAAGLSVSAHRRLVNPAAGRETYLNPVAQEAEIAATMERQVARKRVRRAHRRNLFRARVRLFWDAGRVFWLNTLVPLLPCILPVLALLSAITTLSAAYFGYSNLQDATLVPEVLAAGREMWNQMARASFSLRFAPFAAAAFNPDSPLVLADGVSFVPSPSLAQPLATRYVEADTHIGLDFSFASYAVAPVLFSQSDGGYLEAVVDARTALASMRHPSAVALRLAASVQPDPAAGDGWNGLDAALASSITWDRFTETLAAQQDEMFPDRQLYTSDGIDLQQDITSRLALADALTSDALFRSLNALAESAVGQLLELPTSLTPHARSTFASLFPIVRVAATLLAAVTLGLAAMGHAVVRHMQQRQLKATGTVLPFFLCRTIFSFSSGFAVIVFIVSGIFQRRMFYELYGNRPGIFGTTSVAISDESNASYLVPTELLSLEMHAHAYLMATRLFLSTPTDDMFSAAIDARALLAAGLDDVTSLALPLSDETDVMAAVDAATTAVNALVTRIDSILMLAAAATGVDYSDDLEATWSATGAIATTFATVYGHPPFLFDSAEQLTSSPSVAVAAAALASPRTLQLIQAVENTAFIAISTPSSLADHLHAHGTHLDTAAYIFLLFLLAVPLFQLIPGTPSTFRSSRFSKPFRSFSLGFRAALAVLGLVISAACIYAAYSGYRLSFSPEPLFLRREAALSLASGALGLLASALSLPGDVAADLRALHNLESSFSTLSSAQRLAMFSVEGASGLATDDNAFSCYDTPVQLFFGNPYRYLAHVSNTLNTYSLDSYDWDFDSAGVCTPLDASISDAACVALLPEPLQFAVESGTFSTVSLMLSHAADILRDGCSGNSDTLYAYRSIETLLAPALTGLALSEADFQSLLLAQVESTRLSLALMLAICFCAMLLAVRALFAVLRKLDRVLCLDASSFSHVPLSLFSISDIEASLAKISSLFY